MKQFFAMVVFAVSAIFLIFMPAAGKDIELPSLILSVGFLIFSSWIITDSIYRHRHWFAFSRKPEFKSEVSGHEGDCFSTWQNWNTIYNRLDGGVTGWYKCGKEIIPGVWFLYGKEFHGIVEFGDFRVFSTEGKV